MVHFSNITNETTVIAFLFQVIKFFLISKVFFFQNFEQISEHDNQKINNLTKEIGFDINEYDYDYSIFSLNDFVPDEETLITDGFYRYLGSLTTPPCTQGLKWAVFRTKINISENQVINLNANFNILIFFFVQRCVNFIETRLNLMIEKFNHFIIDH